MKIRTQFILTLSLFGLILIGMVASLILTNQEVDRLLQQEEIARRIEQGASELNYLSGDYLMYGESQQRARWESRFASFSGDVSKLEPANPQQQAIVAHIKANQARLQAVFTNVVSTLEESAESPGAAPNRAFTQVSWSRMEVQNQGMAFEAALLARQLRDEADQLKRLNIILMLVLIGIFGAYLLVNYYLIVQRTLRAIARLRAGIEIIGSGDLNFTIATNRADEIGELSHAFNQMAANLKEVTASKADLEQEITQRERVEEHLRATNERLQEQAEELDAQAEELRVQTEELAAANDQLRESEQRYSTIFDESPFAMSLTKTADGALVGANNAFLELFEFAPEEVIGNSSVDLGLPDMDRCAQGSVQNLEVTRITETGTRRILSLNMNMVSLDGGEHILTTIRDVTERRRAEEALRQVNERLRAQAVEMERQATELQSARLAALNLMEDALDARAKVQQINFRLRESEQRLNRAQEIAHLGSWELDLLNNRLTWSDEVYRIFDLQPQEFAATYEAFLEAVHPDDRARVDEAYSGSIRDGQDRYEIEHRIINRSSGGVRTVHEKCEHFRDERGRIIRSAGMVHDITARKQAEESLREAAEKFRIVADFTYDWEYWRSPENHFHYISPACERITGYAREAFNDDADLFLRIVHPDDRERLAAHYHEDLLRDDAYEFEFRIIRQDGEERWVGHTCRLVLDQQGRALGRRASNRDVTERKRVEEALRIAHDELEQRVHERTEELAIANRELLNEIAERREIERQLRIQTAAMEAAANGILITDPKGNILWTNPALTQVSGYGTDELVGQNTRIFSSGQHERAYYRDMWSTILAGKVWKGETINRRKDGSQYIEGQTITPVRGEEGEISHFIAIKEDITDKKQAEQDIRARNEKEKMLTQMIHTMQLDIARDLHDTLGQNISFLRMKLDYLTGKKIRKQADLQMEIQNMARAANESYDLMRGTLAILQSTDSADLYRLFTRYTEQIEERSGFKVDFSSLGESKPISAPRMRQLFYTFRELLNNVEKHAHASQVTIEMIWAADHLKLIVSDNGRGFDVNQIQFGTHYGLKFLRERVKLLNGSLALRSEPGSGTHVAILIPYETS
jgi:PAS domain S-box-containing protein